jgi:hypothetical protein
MDFRPRKASLILSVFLSLPLVAAAGTRPKKPPYKAPYDVISAVDNRMGTVTIKHINSPNHQAKTFKVDNGTEVQVNGNKGTLKDVKKGLKVDVTVGLDDTKADRLVLSPAPPTPAPHPKPKPHSTP